jgi:hypothetical protein
VLFFKQALDWVTSKLWGSKLNFYSLNFSFHRDEKKKGNRNKGRFVNLGVNGMRGLGKEGYDMVAI